MPDSDSVGDEVDERVQGLGAGSRLVGRGCLRVDVLGNAVLLALIATHEALDVRLDGHEVLDEVSNVAELRVGERAGVDVHGLGHLDAVSALVPTASTFCESASITAAVVSSMTFVARMRIVPSSSTWM